MYVQAFFAQTYVRYRYVRMIGRGGDFNQRSCLFVSPTDACEVLIESNQIKSNCLHCSAPRYLQLSQDVIQRFQPVAEVTSRRRLRSSALLVLLLVTERLPLLGLVLGITYQTSSSTVRHRALSNNTSRLRPIYSVCHFEHITTPYFMAVKS